ncbi:4Fe-4S ferredoxin [Alkalibaculum sp. M08DMB]|uniref:4Fe-4S ferredoxin n=1 Tax=Alkalibaculum sporogenes TaxID=2655001 RepID=A0A6A7KBV9_9FIRM|nr:4Fe-4S binding protein [Alkalibaculum sporogenes]MPW26771.1 4Fe-4S ferredoxin [Alkalibaculum sporogenes]
MKRDIIIIDEEKCNGCGLCVEGCHEGALKMIDGKAKLISESYCDGLGDCLPQCPTDAITIEQRDVAAYDEEAVQVNMAKKQLSTQSAPTGGCPGSRAMTIEHKQTTESSKTINTEVQSELRQWPCQIKLVPPNAPYFDNAHLLIAADCTAYAYANFHNDFMKNKITIIGCPKLDNGDYSDKLTEILTNNEIKSVTVLRMQVPCCGGIESATKQALINSGKMIPWSITTIGTNGNIIEN